MCRPGCAGRWSDRVGRHVPVAAAVGPWRLGRPELSTDTSFSPLAAIKIPRWWPRLLPAGGHENSPGVEMAGLGQGLHPPSGGGLGEAVGVTLGNDAVRGVAKPIERRRGESLGHDLL